MNLEAYLSQRRRLIEEALKANLPGPQSYPPLIHQAMHYSLLAGGKRLRPILVLAAGEAVGYPAEGLLPAACAVEFLHTYSLIHDDLPSMDNDDYRRGRLTCHKVYGEAIAILAGDALLTEAFGLLARQVEAGSTPEATVAAVKELALAAGSRGLVGGQVVDLLAEEEEPDPRLVDYIHRHKTGSLIRACLRLGGILGGATDEQLEKLTRYGEDVGLAFQIVDDLLDILGDTAQTGKPVGSDLKKKKVTYPACFGLEESRRRAWELAERARRTAEELGERAWPLAALAHYVVDRQS
ncbi:polyprenyl synthetase family protein [Thermanaeromonas sp. C210]|uniref:polyprenyl synthetase family protein n=1 Tax=Thermanaeromonas sp. C210 TaxID=2731925 RepID=UPI00155C20B7|nr:farnesyl diphosphate synthase [Thermanaeromonas sp. C210]GFN23328.1 farnesyl-diphosphate synthase [Thermanaeromonas sp. C210]